MRVVPVLDLLQGVVVRGVAGRRETYRPVQSRLTSDVSPLAVARAFRKHFGLDVLYLADLDAIVQARPHRAIYRQLVDDQFHLLVDAGCANAALAQQLLDDGVSRVIVGLESCEGPDALEEICRAVGPERVIFSLDLKDGRPLAAPETWPGLTPRAIGEIGLAQQVDALIVLDLAQVGVGQGVKTAELCRSLLTGKPGCRLVTGGGVRSRDDLEAQRILGATATLVASALHDGRLTRSDLEDYRDGWPVERSALAGK